MQINAIHIVLTIMMNMAHSRANINWPSGSYGLPKPVSGCPEYWSEGYRYQDSEDDHNNNRHSTSYHLSGKVNKHGIRQEFCVKDESLFEDVDIKWPNGEYCIYKYGSECPEGLNEGWIFWDDENQEDLDGGNKVYGHIPEGVYESDTLIYFCCNDKGSASTPINLPLNTPFYLMAYKSKRCQNVSGTQVVSEYIHWDDEDRGNRNAHSKYVPYGASLDAWDTFMYFCYYTAGICGKHGTLCKNSSADDSKLEVKNMMKQHQKEYNRQMLVPSRGSAKAVIIGCSVAGVILGTALTGLLVKHVFNRNVADLEAENGDLEETLPLPDHIW